MELEVKVPMGSTPNWSTRLSRAVLDHPRIVTAFLLVLVGLCVFSLPFFRIDVGIGPYRSDTDPNVEDWSDVRKAFVADQNIYLVYKTDDVFAKPSLELVRTLSAKLKDLSVEGEQGRVPAYSDVMSLTTVRSIEGGEFDVKTPMLVPDPIPADAAALQHIKARARQNPMISEALLSRTDQVAAVQLRLSRGLTNAQLTSVVGQTRALARAAGGSNTSFQVTGGPVVEVDEGAYIVSDLRLFLPLAFLVIVLTLASFVRRFLPVAIGVAGVTLSVGVAMAVLPLLGGSLNSTTIMLPPVVGCLTAAAFIHYVSEIGKNAHHNPLATPLENAELTMSHLLAPSLIVAITTGVGFASNAVTDLPAIRDFAIAVGVGVVAGLVVANLLFALASRNRAAERFAAPDSVAQSPRTERWLSNYADFLARHRGAALGLSLAFIAVAAAGIPRLVVGMDQLAAFDEDTPVRQATAMFEQHIGGRGQMIVSIRHREPGHFVEPEALARLEKLEEFLRTPEVGAGAIWSATDYVKLLHRGFFNDDPKEERIPDTREAVAQLLLINGDPRIREYVNQDQSWVRLVVRIPGGDSTVTAARFAAADRYLKEHFPETDGYLATPRTGDMPPLPGAVTTGMDKVFSYTVNNLTESTLLGFGISFVVVFGLLALLFRSFKTSFAAMPENILPILANLGVMGWLDIRLDPVTLMLSSVGLGLAAEDTIHILKHLRDRLAVHGDIALGIKESLLFKGPGGIATSLATAAGFSVVLLSNFVTARHFGLLTCTAVLIALVGDLVFMPALLLCTKTNLGVKRVGEPARPDATEEHSLPLLAPTVVTAPAGQAQVSGLECPVPDPWHGHYG